MNALNMPTDKGEELKIVFSYFSTKTYGEYSKILSIQKNLFNETLFICLN